MFLEQSHHHQDFVILTDTIQLKQIDDVGTLSVNSGTVVHTGGDHYVGVACIDPCYIECCDSLNRKMANDYTMHHLRSLKPFGAQNVHFKDVTQQIGVECGGLALSFVTHYSFGLSPSEWEFDLTKTRAHTGGCILNKRVSPFLARRIKRRLSDVVVKL